MERIVILGGVPLKGRVEISGAKNAALPVLASSLLSTGVCRITNVPELRDVTTLTKLLSSLGVAIQNPEPRTLVLDPTEIRG
ncbi:MAG: UDP-N-acetylglucosamine 1-carboxyvinyltransferase, partial [bacterium]|nr:UDP-N-acetylglucosamine 1-carboxyvinyltransferase [bacterium]